MLRCGGGRRMARETGCKRKDPGVVKSGCQLVDILLRVRRRKGDAQARCACLHCGGANGGNMHASLEKLPAARSKERISTCRAACHQRDNHDEKGRREWASKWLLVHEMCMGSQSACPSQPAASFT